VVVDKKEPSIACVIMGNLEYRRENMATRTPKLILKQCDAEILHEAIKGHEHLARKLNVTVPENYTEFGVEALRYALDKLSESEDEKGWWTYFPIHQQDNKLIGSGGYKGGPTLDGTVEIGYEIMPEYRNRGLATEMTEGLVQNAFNDERVNRIVAHTLGQENASTMVLKKCGFVKTEELNEPDEGVIWKWELNRSR